MLLLVVTLLRYRRWEGTEFGNWLAKASSDPYVDLLPSVLTLDLQRKFGPWWKTPWDALTAHVITRYVVQQHQTMAYEKTALGERCLLESDGERVFSHAEYRWIGMGNPRFRSVAQILRDLSLLEHKEGVGTVLTLEGERFLNEELTVESQR